MRCGRCQRVMRYGELVTSDETEHIECLMTEDEAAQAVMDLLDERAQ